MAGEVDEVNEVAEVDEIDPGTRIFIDANIFLYVIFSHWRYAEPCGNLLKDVNSGNLSAVSSIIVLSEVFHRVMIAEVVERRCLDPRRAVKYLKENPDEVKNLCAARSSVEKIGEIANLKIAQVGVEIMRLSLDFSRRYGLLSNDAIHLATMKNAGITNLASNDRDFERVEWLRLWKP
jgi:predicted nucleic acid-binding protein